MSLINQMLQDLDARRAPPGDGNALPSAVRTLPPPRQSSLPIVLGALVLLALAGAYGAYQWTLMREAMPPVPPSQPAAAAPDVVAAPAPGPAPVSEPAAAAPVDPASVAPASVAPVKSVPTVTPLLDGSLRMAEVIETPAKGAVETKPAEALAVVNRRAVTEIRPDKNPVQKPAKAAGEARSPSPPVSGLPQAPGKAAVKTVIEKSDVSGTPQERAEADYRKSINALNQGRAAEAVAGLQKALRHNGLHAASRQLLVRLLLESGRQDEAMQVLSDGLQEQPAHLGWAMSLARLQMDRGEVVGAWKTLDHSLPAASGNADYQGFAGHVLHRLGRHREAAGLYQSATRVSPGDGRWWLGMGLALDADGRSGEARAAFQRARQSGTLSSELSALVDQKLRQ